MGFFSFLFGTGTSSTAKLDLSEHQVSKQEIERLVSRMKIKSLDAGEEKLIERIIEKRRLGDGKISLRHIDEALRKLEFQKKISQYDRKGVMKVFTEYFQDKFE
ncbi:hypothetical protein HOF40_04060 [Candidatus Parcubacteria bacterium]|jgi:hypothetical protein|nr:hypothetical protein [Candidatus Parcubacteria bacterium]MBT3949236.1 hypothetical protein [Candidatus Parcubacteria bacterium]